MEVSKFDVVVGGDICILVLGEIDVLDRVHVAMVLQ
jgi:hypothetical protein